MEKFYSLIMKSNSEKKCTVQKQYNTEQCKFLLKKEVLELGFSIDTLPINVGAHNSNIFYLFNWAAKWRRNGYIEWIASISGLVQTVLYADFFYYYYKAQKTGAKMKLPSSRSDLWVNIYLPLIINAT